MLGTNLQYGRGHGEDRFYDAAKARRNPSHNHNLQRSRTSTTSAPVSSPVSKIKAVAGDDPSSPSSNLDRFLEATTPSVPAQYPSKTRTRGWRTCDVDYRPYFILGDLWESFKEWSAYGAGVPLVLNGSDCVVQYYVPYLSAIQLYGELSRPDTSPRRLGEESDADCSKDSSSDGSSDCELDRGLKYSRDRSRKHLASTSTLWLDRLSSREKQISLQEGGSSSDDSEAGNSFGCLRYEYLEQKLPYSREPLADKVLDLALEYPELRTLRSCDLSPSSWISVAWYPIYRIPTGPTLKDLDACFLTFHSLSTPMTGAAASTGGTIRKVDGVPMISLPAFGMASYKFKGLTWTPSSSGFERQLANSLLKDAGNWLRQHSVSHPDYQFFASHAAYTR